MTKILNLVRVKSVVVFSVLSLVAAFLVSGVVGVTAAQAATPKELTTFEFAGGTLRETCGSTVTTATVVGGSVTNGTGTIIFVRNSTNHPIPIANAKATATSLKFDVAGTFSTSLPGQGWGPFSGTSTYTPSHTTCTAVWTKIALKNPPAAGKKPRVPLSVQVAGTPTAKSYKVSWKKPSTKGNRPVAGYRVHIKAAGTQNVAINKRLGKGKRSYTVKRSALLKSLRSLTRGEGNVRFNVRVYALNSAGSSAAVTSRIWVRP